MAPLATPKARICTKKPYPPATTLGTTTRPITSTARIASSHVPRRPPSTARTWRTVRSPGGTSRGPRSSRPVFSTALKTNHSEGELGERPAPASPMSFASARGVVLGRDEDPADLLVVGGLQVLLAGVDRLALVERHDLLGVVAVLVERDRAQHAPEVAGLAELLQHLLAGRHAAVVGVDGLADRGHDQLGARVPGDGVGDVVDVAGVLLVERVDRGPGVGHLVRVLGRRRPVHAGRRGRGVGQALDGHDAVTAHERRGVREDALHLAADDARLVRVGAAEVDALGAGVLRAAEERPEVVGRVGVEVLQRQHDLAAELLELSDERLRDALAVGLGVVTDRHLRDLQLVVGVVGVGGTLVVVRAGHAEVVVGAGRPQAARVVAGVVLAAAEVLRDLLGQARVRVGGLIIDRLSRLATGISAAATFELNGPTMARTFELASSCWTFWAPFCGSCLPLTASSSDVTLMV